MNETTYLTKARVAAYQQELEFLETVGAKKLAKYLGSATGSGMGRPAFGPAAELDQDFLSRVNKLKSKLRTVCIIEDARERADITRVFIGATVTLYDMDEGEIVQYTIVGPDDLDIARGLISYQSPIGSALIDHSIGDIVEIEIRKGPVLRYRIDTVEKLPLEVEIPESHVQIRISRLA